MVGQREPIYPAGTTRGEYEVTYMMVNYKNNNCLWRLCGPMKEYSARTMGAFKVQHTNISSL